MDREQPGKRTGGRAPAAPIIAYADDVTIFVSSVTDFAIIEDALRHFKRASGATINPRKSKTLAVGGWRTEETILDIQYCQSVTILGIIFWGTITKRQVTHGRSSPEKCELKPKRHTTEIPI
jgi:hypothetical protein